MIPRALPRLGWSAHFACALSLFIPLSVSSQALAAGAAVDATPSAALVEQVFAEVEAVRGLKRKHPVQIEFLDDAAFLAAMHAHSSDLDPAKVSLSRAEWIAFGLAPPDVDPIKLFSDASDEQIAGFYEPKTKRLCIRKHLPKPAPGAAPNDLRGLIAHELEHALQDQNFPGALASEGKSDEEALAMRALIEGDAEATRLAVRAHRAHQPLGYAMGATATAIRSLSLEELIKRSGHSKALMEMPAVVRESLLMPYTSGLALVADIYRRGGFKLVDAAFAHPPVTSHQVLHPESYFSGEKPAQIPPPAAPAGARVLETGTLGELGARVVLETCVAPHVVRNFSDGWRGDLYTLYETPAHALGVVWRSAWSAGEGGSVAQMLRSQEPCWRDSAQGTSPDGFSIDSSFRARNASDRVALVRGSASGDLDRALSDALDFHPAEVPPEPPLGALAPPRADLKPVLDGDKFTSPRMGLTAEIPDGLDPDIDSRPAELVLKSFDRSTFAALFVLPEPYTQSHTKQFLDAQLLIMTGGRKLTLISERPLKLLGKIGVQRTWGKGEDQLSIGVVPACGGAAYDVLLAVHRNLEARKKIEQFVASLHTQGDAGACADLKD